MAQLGGTFDANTVAPSTPFALLPAGNYLAQIIASEMRPTKDGRGKYLWLEFDVLSGEHMGARLWDRLNLQNANPKAVTIAEEALSAICHATGVMNVSDSEELHMRPLTLKVIVKPGEGQYGPGNEIKGYSAPAAGSGGTGRATGYTPRPASTPAPARVAQAVSGEVIPPKNTVTPVQPGAAPPWRRAS